MKHYHLDPANYADYREFLKSRYLELKNQNARFSLNACAQKSKISKALLQFIFNKKRHLSLDRMPNLAKTLKLTVDEEYFVYLMICKNSSRNPVIQKHFEEILGRIRSKSVKVDSPEPENSKTNDKDLYLNSLLMILQTLLRLKGFKEDISWILENVRIANLSEEKIKNALTELEEKGFITRDSDGKLSPKPETLWRPDPYDPSGFRVYTSAAESIAELMQTPKVYRPSVYMSMSLAMDEENLLKAEKLMIEVHHQLLALSKKSKDPNAVVQIGNFLLTVVRLRDTC